MFKRIIILLMMVQYCIFSSAQEINKLQDTTVTFSSTKLTVKEMLDEINQQTNVSIVYGGTDAYLKIIIVLPSRTMTVQKALEEIKANAPVELIYLKDHVIVRARKLARSYLLKGTIKDASSNLPMIAADIFIAGTTTGTVTDDHGKFSMNLPPGTYHLICKYVGYQDYASDVSLYQDKDLEITMDTKKNEINEVNVTGSLQEINDIEKGRNITTIGAKTLDRLPNNNVTDALHGTVTGVWTTKVSGAPGDHNKIRIRGISSIFASTDPLYVVDGMIIPTVNYETLGISDLNSHDVNSITVLKDAASTALYGYLGGNGVILIETKKGGGKTKFHFGIKRGYQQLTKRYPLMNSESFLSTLDSSDSKINTSFYSVKKPVNDKYPFYQDSLGNTLGSDNFQNEIFRIGKVGEIQLSGQGSLKKTDFYISGDYYTNQGIVINSKYDKYTLTGNFSRIIKNKASFRILYKGSHQENKNNLDNYLGNKVIYRGINYEPAYRSTPDSFFLKLNRFYYNPPSISSDNTLSSLSDFQTPPDSLFNTQEKKKNENANTMTMMGYYRLNNEFSLNAVVSLSLRNALFSSYIPSLKNDTGSQKFLSSKENYVVFSQQYDLHYEKTIKNQHISAFIRFMNYKDNVYWKVDSTLNVDISGLSPENNVYLRSSQAIYGEQGSVIRSINSVIATASYTFKNKYFISLIANESQLKEGYYVHHKDIFPSVAINWDVSKERLLHMPSWVNGLNLYTNWGQAGNYPLNSLSNDLYSTSSRYAANDIPVPAVYISNLANHHLTYEKVTEYNYGTKINLLQNRIIFSADHYVKYNSNLLIKREIPLYYGGGFFYQNIGEMKNSGLELSLELTPVDKPSFYWTTGVGYSTNHEHIKKLVSNEPINFSNTDLLFPDFYARVNESLGAITGYSFQGKWKNLSEAQKKSGKYVQSFGIAYLKTDTTSTTLSANDKVVVGNSIPKFNFHWTNELVWKNFSCEMLWYGSIGFDKYNATKAATYITGTNTAVRNLVLDSVRCLIDPAFYESSYFVENASFVRLKTLSFTYNQPKKVATTISMKYTLTLENLITLTHYTGYDPEATTYTDNNFTDNAIDMGAYPNPRAVYFSIGLTF